jgi:hypothetical protein
MFLLLSSSILIKKQYGSFHNIGGFFNTDLQNNNKHVSIIFPHLQDLSTPGHITEQVISPWLLTLQGPSFAPRSVYVAFVVDKVAATGKSFFSPSFSFQNPLNTVNSQSSVCRLTG